MSSPSFFGVQSQQMKLLQLSLIHFRNHIQLNDSFDHNVVVIVGENASGKTNILEAIFLLATGDSFREGKIEERVNYSANVGHVGANVIDIQGKEVELRVTLTRGFLHGKRVAKRRLFVNGVGRSKQKFAGGIACVVFRPEDLRIIEGSPGRRRRFLDEVLSQADFEYRRSLQNYMKGVVRRNKTLEMIREGQTNRTALEFWDRLVLKEGEFIQKKRQGLVEFFNSHTSTEGFFNHLQMEYDISVMSPKRLQQYADREVFAGHTLVGPHRDDFFVKSLDEKFDSDGRNLAVYGSRGEQRMGVLWLKLQSLEYLNSELGQRPLLLLDDIFSELDHNHRELVFSIMDKQQTIATTADEHYIQGLEALHRIDLEKN